MLETILGPAGLLQNRICEQTGKGACVTQRERPLLAFDYITLSFQSEQFPSPSRACVGLMVFFQFDLFPRSDTSHL